jgi:hypothetical protein
MSTTGDRKESDFCHVLNANPGFKKFEGFSFISPFSVL